jgi:hypothetical protein
MPLKKSSRKITRDVHEDARDHARSFVGTQEFEQSRDERKKRDAICASQNPSPL